MAEFLSLASLVIPLSSFTIIFAELIPKTYALKNSEWVILTLSQPMIYFSYVAYPAVAILESIVKAANKFIGKKMPNKSHVADHQSSLYELTAALALARTSRLIGAQQEKIVYVRGPAFLKADQRHYHFSCRHLHDPPKVHSVGRLGPRPSGHAYPLSCL